MRDLVLVPRFGYVHQALLDDVDRHIPDRGAGTEGVQRRACDEQRLGAPPAREQTLHHGTALRDEGPALLEERAIGDVAVGGDPRIVEVRYVDDGDGDSGSADLGRTHP